MFILNMCHDMIYLVRSIGTLDTYPITNELITSPHYFVIKLRGYDVIMRGRFTKRLCQARVCESRHSVCLSGLAVGSYQRLCRCEDVCVSWINGG